jgi:hypothetical protein
MNYLKKSKFILAHFVAVCLLFNQAAWAGFVSTEQIISYEQEQAIQNDIFALLEKEEIAAQLEKQGVEKDEVKQRIALLSQQELVDLQNNLNNLPAGEGAVGAVVGALLIVFIILLVTDLVGATDVFDFDD